LVENFPINFLHRESNKVYSSLVPEGNLSSNLSGLEDHKLKFTSKLYSRKTTSKLPLSLPHFPRLDSIKTAGNDGSITIYSNKVEVLKQITTVRLGRAIDGLRMNPSSVNVHSISNQC